MVVQVYADQGSSLDLPAATGVLNRQRFDPQYVPTVADATRYFSIQRGPYTVPAPARAPHMLVTWYGPGGIPLPADPAWKLDLLTAYNNAARPSAQFRNETTGVEASFLISENLSGKPTSESCRKDIMDGILKGQGSLITNSTEGTLSDGQGGTYATASHFLRMTREIHNHDVFAFAGNAKVCAEIQVSAISSKPDEDKRLADALDLFHPDLSYHPTYSDYFALASAFNKDSVAMSAPFFDAALQAMPTYSKDSELLTERRIATDVVVIVLGMKGNFKVSRAYAERGIKADPDYPLNYYNLACADAEQGKAADAKLHLQQAFDRRANTIPGEKMPEPTTDDSIVKLKSNKEFWAFVQTLPKN